MATKQQHECLHENFFAKVAVNRFSDSGKFLAEVSISCTDCELPFRCIGVSAGLAWEHPTCSIDSTTINIPIEPEFEAVIQRGATFVMPEKKPSH